MGKVGRNRQAAPRGNARLMPAPVRFAPFVAIPNWLSDADVLVERDSNPQIMQMINCLAGRRQAAVLRLAAYGDLGGRQGGDCGVGASP
jgi:hypothetical protein